MNGHFLQIRILALCLLCCLTAAPALAWNQLPIPDINNTFTPYEQYIASGDTVTLNGNMSRDEDGWIIDYEWQVYKWNGSSYSYYGIQWGSPTSRRFTTPAKYKLYLYVEDNNNEWSSSSDICFVTAVRTTLSGGGYIGGIGAGGPIALSLEPTLSTGDVTLTKSRSNTGDVKVYLDSGLTNELTLPATWASGSVPSTLYVKGTANSSALNDVTLTMSYVRNSVTVDSDPETFTVVNLEITSPTGTDHDVAFNSSSPGVCTFTAAGTTGISGLDQDIEWTVPNIPDSNLTSSPSPARASSVAFTYTTLPGSNNSFGSKTLTATLRNSQGAVVSQTTDTIRIFFDPEATNHPGGGSPNWFYYWKEGMVVPELANSQFVYDSNQNYGLYDPCSPPGQGQLRVGPKAGGSDAVNTVFHNHFFSTRLLTGENGINDSPRFSNPQYGPIDDNDLIDYGNGEADAVAIIPGADGILQTQRVPDDERVQVAGVWVITTGDNGRLETQADPCDTYQKYMYDNREIEIALGNGKPGTIAVTPGSDGWLDLELYIRVDDQIDMSTLDFNDTDLNYDYIGEWHGIDICAITCIHELVHKANYDNGGRGSSDHDQDGVITDNEGSPPHYYLSYCIRDTYDLAGTLGEPNYVGYGDDEFLCRIAEMGYVDPNALSTAGKTDPDKDWSKEGKQWQTY